MARAARAIENQAGPPPEPRILTLLDLVAAVAEVAKTEAEVISAVRDLVNSGSIRLVGSFRGADVRIG